jgi:SMODS-associating 4TM effector domain
MNAIPLAQNEPRQIERLAAQRRLYSVAKRILGVEVLLGAPLAIAWSILAMNFAPARGYAAFWGVLVSMSDVLWLDPWQKRLREQAAKVQELFDCDVLQLPWNDIRVGSRPDPEVIKEHYDKYKKNASRISPLNNWYPTVVGNLPLPIARIVCQRSNCWWDSKQRRTYAIWVVTGAVFTIVAILGVGLVGGLTIEKLFLAIVVPLTPAIILAIRQYSEQMEAANRLEKLKEHTERIWSAALGLPVAQDTIVASRSLQDEIYENRKKSPLVFDWIFRHLRGDYESRMKHGATAYAEEAQRKLGISANSSL